MFFGAARKGFGWLTVTVIENTELAAGRRSGLEELPGAVQGTVKLVTFL